MAIADDRGRHANHQQRGDPRERLEDRGQRRPPEAQGAQGVDPHGHGIDLGEALKPAQPGMVATGTRVNKAWGEVAMAAADLVSDCWVLGDVDALKRQLSTAG